MTVEVRPLGDKCNIKCRYCYQDSIRTAGNVAKDYDMDAMLATLDGLEQPFSLFGGEVMMVDDADLERLMAFGRERHGGSGLQTNGTLVEDKHLEMFRKYRVRVGISLDGPGPLNDVRWAGSLVATRRATARTEALIERLCRLGMPPRVTVTLHRLNAGAGRLDTLCEWLKFLDRLGVCDVRLHTLETDTEDVKDRLKFERGENLQVMRRLRRLEPQLARLRFDVFGQMASMLRGDDTEASCIFHACDAYATKAVIGVEGDGRLSNCGRTYKDGVAFLKAPTPGFERQLALHATPWDQGGCKDCRFFLMCKGNCPGTAIDGDWRLRSADCALWFSMFEDIEQDMVAGGEEPLSLSAQREPIERMLLDAWTTGLNPSLRSLCGKVAAGQ
jgi:uncharacterized protein